MVMMAFIFGVSGIAFGIVAFVEVQKLKKKLEEKGIL
tara:strand:+ start:239 stop:349 length:111 start_codon:yes stop_codon:yes gene_type:complete